MTSTLSTREPVWCDGQHHPGYRVHSREVANLVNDFHPHDAVVVSVKQYPPDREPVISVTTVTDDEDVITHLAPTVAVALGDAFRALGQAGTLIDAIDEAADLIEGALDHPGVKIVEDGATS
jgi:hypothetical protein